MQEASNEYGQPIGWPLPHWKPRAMPARAPLEGEYCALEPLLDPVRHGADLSRVGRAWTYMPVGHFDDEALLQAYLQREAASTDPLHFAVVDAVSGQALGTMALLHMDPTNGVIEVGHIAFSPALQRTRAATEAQYLLMHLVFHELGYRRYEWKCDRLNAPSREAAAQLGFQFEGTFRPAVVYKQRTRDTAWFSTIDSEWPALREALVRWLAPANFDAQGRQRTSLARWRGAAGT